MGEEGRLAIADVELGRERWHPNVVFKLSSDGYKVGESCVREFRPSSVQVNNISTVLLCHRHLPLLKKTRDISPDFIPHLTPLSLPFI